MERFKNILLVADRGIEGENILNRAVNLAKKNRAHLTVVEVLKKMPNDLKEVIPSSYLPDIQEEVMRERSEGLERFIKPVKAKSVIFSTKILIGISFLEIIREVLKNKHDLVMIGAEGEGGFKEMVFGTTTMHLMRKCPCPVWVIKSEQAERYSTILAAVDPDPDDAKKNALNVRIMELASSMARLEKSDLHVVHVWETHDEYLYSRRLASNLTDKVVRDLRIMHRSRLIDLLKECKIDLPSNQIHLFKGEPGMAIENLAKELQVELIVMGTVARTGISGMYMGNTAEEVLHTVDCSVLTIKPDGFVTPVSL